MLSDKTINEHLYIYSALAIGWTNNECRYIANGFTLPVMLNLNHQNNFMEKSIIFQASPRVTIATNTFINVPVVLKYEDINLIEIVKREQLGYTTQIPIYHQDGTY